MESPGSRVGRFAPAMMRIPLEVQVAYGSGTSGANATCAFGRRPKPGNLLLFMAGGHTTGITTPSGLTEIGTAINQNNQQARTWIRRVQSGDGTSWSFSEAADTVSAYGIELQDAGLVQMKSQFTLSGSTTAVANPIAFTATDWTTMIKYVPSLYYVFYETDATPTTIAPTSDFTMFAIPPASNHPCYLFRKKKPINPNDGAGFGAFYSVTGQTVQGTIGMGITVGGLVY